MNGRFTCHGCVSGTMLDFDNLTKAETVLSDVKVFSSSGYAEGLPPGTYLGSVLRTLDLHVEDLLQWQRVYRRLPVSEYNCLW